MKFKIKYFNEIHFHSLYRTALHFAAQKGNLDIIKLLLMKKGIDINIKDIQGNKPIDYSANFEVKKLLSK